MFVPVPRIHNNWDIPAKFPWSCSEKAEKLYRKALCFRYQITPYFYHWAVMSSITGEPILRPMVYHNRNNRECQICDDQFYVGENMIFAPVTEEGAISRTVYLPEGIWYSWWTGEKYQGLRKIEVKSPLYELSGLPIFVKAGSVIPMQPVTKNLPDELPENLILKLFPYGNSHFELKESAAEKTIVHMKRINDASYTLLIDNQTGTGRKIKLIDKTGKTLFKDLKLEPGKSINVDILL
jgi:alpha-glucosidase